MRSCEGKKTHMCDVCARDPPPFTQDDDARVTLFCPLCLDALLAAFPLTPRRLLRRELTGRLPMRTPLSPIYRRR